MSKLLVAAGIAIVAVTAAWAGEIYLELPANFDAEMVYHPTDADRRALAEFTFSALADLDNSYTVRIVRFTKDGKPISRDYGQGKDMEAPPTLADVHFLRSWGFSDKQWNDLWYHLHWKGEEQGYYGVYDLARDEVSVKRTRTIRGTTPRS